MRKLRFKLHSSRGASMILAMVFMLFCVFVGGSVLTAATANAQRVERLANQQQALNQRSAALLLSDALQGKDRTRMKLTVYDDEKTVVFSVAPSSELTALQRIVYESAIRRYLQTISPRNPSVRIEQFVCQSASGSLVLDSPEKFLIPQPAPGGAITGKLHLSGRDTARGLPLADLDVPFVCGTDYDFTLTLDDSGTQEIRMDAYLGTSRIPAQTPDKADTTVTVISWMAPRITKGAANG